MKIIMTSLFLFLLSVPAHAHYAWLERDGGTTAKACFGHWHQEMYEVSGGRLDNFKVDVVVPEGIVTATTRKQDHVELKLAKDVDIAWIEAMNPRKMRNSEEVTRGILLARSGRSEARSLVPLDLIPSAPNSDELILSFQGKPMPVTEITVYNPKREEVKYTTDAAGKVTLDTRLPGQYLAIAVRMDEQPGEVNGVAYQKTRYGLTLSFIAGR